MPVRTYIRVGIIYLHRMNKLSKMTTNDIIAQIVGWELHKWSSTSSLGYLCQIKADLIRYVIANCPCTEEEKSSYEEEVRKINMRFGALREYARSHDEDFEVNRMSMLRQNNYKVMKHRYENSPYWGEINMYLGLVRNVVGHNI